MKKYAAVIVVASGLLLNSTSHATTISCESETNKLKTELSFAFDPVNLTVKTTYDGMALKPYVFVSETAACGEPLAAPSDCTKREIKDALKPGEYDFQFACKDGRRGELHFEANVVMAYCYKANGALANQRGGSNCTLR